MAQGDSSSPAARHLANTSVQLLPSPPSTDGIDITKYIKFKLDAAIGNYNKWRNFFLFVLTKYNARDHVEEETDPHLADEAWRAADVDIVLWIYTTISDELQDVILQADSTAYVAWQALAHFFTENAEGREIYLDKEFNNIVQGDMSVVAYCRKLKGVADQLGDVGAPVTDKKLTMRLIDGLDERFKVQQEMLELAQPFPSFMQAQSRLQLAEEKLKSKAKSNPQILHASTNGNTNGAPVYRFHGNCYSCGESGHMARNCPRGGGQQGRGGGQQQPNGRGGGQYGQYNGFGNQGYNGYNGGRGRGRGRGRGDHGGRGGYNPGYGYQQPHPGYGQPSYGHQQQGYGGAPHGYQQTRPSYAPPNAAGVLGPRPGMHSQVYPVMHSPTAAPMHPVPVATPTHTYDYSAMFSSAPSHNHGFHPGGEWVMDSGATTHVTNNQGPSNTAATYEIQ